MADNKASFVLYADLLHTVKKLPPEKAGELFKIILEYVNDLNPAVDDPLLDIVFEPIKHQLKRDLVKWENVKTRKSEGGKKSAELRKAAKELENSILNSSSNVKDTSTGFKTVEDTLSNSTQVNISQDTSRSATVNVNDTVNVNVNDTVNVIKEINKESGVLPIPNALGFFADMSEVKTVLLPPSKWQDVFCMQHGLKLVDFPHWIDKFYNHAVSSGKQYLQTAPFQEHFNNWINKQPKNVHEAQSTSKQTEKPLTAIDRYNLARKNQLPKQ
jgi:hypothetical protein